MTRFAIVLIAAAGCMNGDNPRDASTKDHYLPDSGQDRSQRPDARSRDAVDAQSHGALSGILRWFTSKQPIANVDICVYQDGKKTSQCAQSNAAGAFVIAVPAKVEVALLFEVADMPRWALPVVAEAASNVDIGVWSIFTDVELGAMFAKVSLSYPPVGRGVLWVNGDPGDKIATVPSAGVGPYYVDASGIVLDLSLTAMTGVSFPAGTVFDLAPATYDVQVSNSTMKCVNKVGWPSTAATLRAPVLDGYVAVVKAKCT